MMFVRPAHAEERMVLRTGLVADVIQAVGTPAYPKTCFRVLAESFDVDHWALFHYGRGDSVRCLATASRAYETAAEQNVSAFVSHCHKVDPALGAYRQNSRADPWLVKMAIGDIHDRQYRRCFEATHVRERLSFFAGGPDELIQLCVYRGSAAHAFSAPEMRLFASLARLVIATGEKHDSLVARGATSMRQLDVEAIEQRLDSLQARLSKREREVCARAVLGRTIIETALDLAIERTSVITYRQRAYQKLKIGRQTDLLALVYDVRRDRIQ